METDKQKPSILQVLPEINSGGVERGTVDLSIYAKSQGIRMIVASNGGSFEKTLSANGIEHFRLDLKTKNPFKIIANSIRLRNFCKTENVGLIHARSRAPAWSAYICANMLDLPFITTFHGFYRVNFFLKKCYNSVMAKGNTVIAVSEFIKRHIIEVYKTDDKKITVIHRGVDVHEFNPAAISADSVNEFRWDNGIASDTKIILLPGRLTRWKGHDIAIKAAHLLGNKNYVMLFAGRVDKTSGFYEELEYLIKEYHLEAKIKFMGDVKNMPLLYAASDIILSTSVEPETFGRVSAEAGAMGKPVIATAHGGSIEIIKDGETGFLVPPRNERELVSKIEDCINRLENRDMKGSFAHNVRQHIKDNFSLEKMCEATLAVYRKYGVS